MAMEISNRLGLANVKSDYIHAAGRKLEDIHEQLLELEAKGEVKVIHIKDENKAIEADTLFGWKKKIPTNKIWHHKSCGQCGNIPGYPVSLLWFMNQMGLEYVDERNQTSCTAWNYHGSATSNPVGLAAVAVRNWHRAYELGLFPLFHCATTFGDYKEMRNMLVEYKELRDEVRRIMHKIGRELVIPEYIVHYSEWVHVMRFEIAKLKKYDLSNIIATVHPACHTYKMIPEDCIYDKDIYAGKRTAVSTGVALALGAQVADYSTWYDCCGFGFRHILTEREASRSFVMDRKIRPMVREAHSDVCITQDTGCTTTLDKNQWIGKAMGYTEQVPVMADVMFAALACGADVFKIVQLQWHTTDWRPLCEKMGIDWKKSEEEYNAYLEELKAGGKTVNLYEYPKS